MGGNALGYPARRIDTAEMDKIVSEMRILAAEYNPIPVQAYRMKPDHGDVDFVLLAPNYGVIRDHVLTVINPRSHYDNNPVLSFDYTGVQIDFTVARTPEDQQSLVNYMAWNDLGNFIGRTARTINFKYGHDGLRYVVRLADHYTREILVSQDIGDILTFLMYDADEWRAGFDTAEDIFRYAASSPLFNAAYFMPENRAHRDRTRDAKRSMYRGMVEYIEAEGIQVYDKLTQDERDDHIDRADAQFGSNIRGQIAQMQAEYAKAAEIKAKLNGTLVHEWTGLVGKQLGATLTVFRAFLENEYTASYLETATAEDVERVFKVWYSTI